MKKFTADSELQTRTVTQIEVELEEQRKEEKVNMLHAFCPFRGKKQNALMVCGLYFS